MGQKKFPQEWNILFILFFYWISEDETHLSYVLHVHKLFEQLWNQWNMILYSFSKKMMDIQKIMDVNGIIKRNNLCILKLHLQIFLNFELLYKKLVLNLGEKSNRISRKIFQIVVDEQWNISFSHFLIDFLEISRIIVLLNL